MKKALQYGHEARQALAAGVDALADTVKITLESVLKLAECRIGAYFFVRQGDWTQES